jgi:DNA-binding LacI/PurR family transcriptional regulator
MRNRFPNKPARVTIGDVAAAAGVSKATVSKYLGKGDYYVADDTRRRIANAIRELDFQPNAMAQSLSRRRSSTIGVVVASVVNPFYPELIAGIEEVIGPSEYTLLLGSSDGLATKETNIVRSMMRQQVEGVIMASVTMRDREVARLVESGLDVVLASRNLSRSLVDTVVVDNEMGARLAVEHLLSHGHTRIGHIGGPQNVVPFRLRLAGYRDELVKAGQVVDEDVIVSTRGSVDDGAEAIDALLTLPKPPSAVFVASDSMAVGVLEGCSRQGVRVPEDLALVGFDNIWVGRVPGVRMTTVDSKARQVGRTAATLLSARIEARWAAENAETFSPETLVLQPDLVVRRSCGCPDSPEASDSPGAAAPLLGQIEKPVS